MQIYLAKNGQQSGPYSEMQVREQLLAREITATDLAWRTGMTEWQPLHQVIALEGVPPGLALVPALAAPPAMELYHGPNAIYTGPPLAGRGSRLIAILVDFLLGLTVLFPGGGFIALTVKDSEHDLPQLIIGITLMVLGALAVMGVQMYLLATRGQTVGKRLMGIKIVTFADNQNPGFVKAVLLRAIVPNLIAAVPAIGGTFGLVDVFCIFREDRRCLHDLIAETKVVEANASVESLPAPEQDVL